MSTTSKPMPGATVTTVVAGVAGAGLIGYPAFESLHPHVMQGDMSLLFFAFLVGLWSFAGALLGAIPVAALTKKI